MNEFKVDDSVLVELEPGAPFVEAVVKGSYNNYDRYCVRVKATGEVAYRGSAYVKALPKTKPLGGPSGYYDLPFKDWVTLNDMMEHLADKGWKPSETLHLKEVLKASTRWGHKKGTSKEYDSRKIVYSGLRLLTLSGGDAQSFLKDLMEDPQFK